MTYRPSSLHFSRISRFAAALALAAALSPAPAWSQQAAAPAPEAAAAAPAADGRVQVGALATVPAPSLTAKAWLTMDVNSGQIIASVNPDERVEPASLTKLMAAYLVFDALENKRLTLEQSVTVSEKAWKTEGSRMFIKPNSQVTIDELLQGVIVQSGNDATVALAEAVAGSENAFVSLMNDEAARQGLKDTHFTNSPGLPDPTHLTTVRDLAVLAQNLITRFPQYLHYYSQKEYTYNKIKQNNRNRLLWTDPTVDGLKTGHTQSAGYCLVATAVRDGRRVLSVVVGSTSDSARSENSLKLLNWSFQNFDTVKLFDDTKPAVTARVWEGQIDSVGLGSRGATWVTVPRGQSAQVKPVAQYAQPLVAPLKKGDRVGTLSLSLDGKVLREEPLYVLQDVPEAGFFGRIYDKILMLFE
ncbi:D-alanyl-D-alanine carboxypeptidase family protein [Parapusillimonas granuli]|uniref:serine-type D-Ala-D-Ala carboxypeptidase n=1 Tax=Parapusillimonas granuli TaxID=380911 RepID=A0A853G1V7_9BURK|nr:D-alanyl-D-alanine carboxypeptidase family protein [Parapusillimonas granuli]MBB5215481.1 D-alanyl-D-alanine carboxypeptidase (penicillin-binding protein 5/6) [Parapusillimonas granuli]MEB2400318.1 D-alanyl-D-alanine carboxypeptidase [Alcaligenaceae bacterium]NYT49852.1 D-alanyl-D-alanine carboxypeptidase [Parapusillimonas granuli]